MTSDHEFARAAVFAETFFLYAPMFDAEEGKSMAARKSVLKPAPRRPELDRLLAASIVAGVTDDQLQEQRISFAYGNAPSGSRITKESAREAARSLRIRRG